MLKIYIIYGTLGVMLLISCITDITRRKIYNVITFPSILLGLILNTIFGGLGGLLWSFIGFITAFIIFFIFFIMKGVKGGDLKLMAAVGALTGFPFIIWAIFYTLLSGGIIALITIIWKGSLTESLKRIWRLLKGIFFQVVHGVLPQLIEEKEDTYISYAIAITFGTLWALFIKNGEMLNGLSLFQTVF